MGAMWKKWKSNERGAFSLLLYGLGTRMTSENPLGIFRPKNICGITVRKKNQVAKRRDRYLVEARWTQQKRVGNGVKFTSGYYK